MASQRVVITGIGVVSAIGCDVESFWRACLEGVTRVEPVPSHWHRFASLRSRIWSPLPPLAGLLQGIHASEVQQIDPVTAMAVSAGMQAVTHAGLKPVPVNDKHHAYVVPGIEAERAGVFIGTGVGGASSFANAHAHHLLHRALRELNGAVAEAAHETPDSAFEALTVSPRFNPFSVSMLMPNAVSTYCGIKLGLRGENETVVAACASGTAAIGHAFDALKHNRVDVALAGGAEYLFDAHGSIFRGFDACRTLVRESSGVDAANRPFDEQRSGFLFSQGGACLLCLETLENAEARGVEPIAEIVAYCDAFDGHSMMKPNPSGEGLHLMLQRLLQAGKIHANDVDYVNAHGNSTLAGDAVEAQVLCELFSQRPWVNSTKSLLGHTMGASGAFEAGVTALSIQRQCVHASLNLDAPIAELKFANATRDVNIEHAISHSTGFGGHSAGLLLRRAA